VKLLSVKCQHFIHPGTKASVRCKQSENVPFRIACNTTYST